MLKPTTLAMILAGGRADELNVLTYYRPKAAVPFGGFARVIDFSLSNLMNSGIEQVAILSQYRSYSLINHIGNGAAWDMIGRYRGVSILPPFIDADQNDWYRGSADAVYKNLDFVKYSNPEEVLILSGDHIYQMDYSEVIAYHYEKDADLTIVCKKITPGTGSRFGMAGIDDEDGDRGGKVTSYQEKGENPEGEWSSLTVLCFKPEVLYQVLEENQSSDSFEFGRDIIPMLMSQGRKIYGYKFNGYWGYTRTVQEYWQANMDLLGDYPLIDMEQWGVRTNLEHRGVRDHQPALIGKDAQVVNSQIYNGCVVEGTVKNSILFPGVQVGYGSVVEDSVIFFKNIIGNDCLIRKTISDVNSTYGNNIEIGCELGATSKQIAIVGWANEVPDGTKLGQGVTISPSLKPEKWPKEVESGRVLR
ncbi:MAG: glucose-1-phosphate adenylyltransferase [Desulfobacterales bacterium]|nr:glucose-1-phosphate adenylyltransferase [Deltaproteobacteria bacterium]NNK94404.1 glucose-1-phosphate adenylyltransferase [Desulfobacterales bacterium]